MAGLLTLPLELFCLIMSQLDTEAYKTLRLINRTLCDFASREVFRVISLYDEEKSCESFKSLIQSPRVKAYVRKIYLYTVEDDYDPHEEGEKVPPRGWQKLLQMLPELPKLESIVLRFDQNCGVDRYYGDRPQTELYRTLVMKWLFAGLVSLQQPLKELGIRNHQDTAPAPGILSDQMNQVLSMLESLRLSVTHERDPAAPEARLYDRAPHRFFRHVLPTYWLNPAMGSLRKLSLYSKSCWGFGPAFKLEGLYFPKLTSLTLGQYNFYEDKQRDWILSHSNLEELHFDNCSILIEFESDITEGTHRSIYPGRWYDYFDAIGKGLPRLRHFGYGTNDDWEFDMIPFEKEKEIVPILLKDRYMIFKDHECVSLRWVSGIRWPHCEDLDRDALKALYQKIGQQVYYGRVNIGRCCPVLDLMPTRGYY